MKKLLSTIVLLAVSAGLATAGDYYSKAPVSKGPIVVPPPVCPCFDPGVELSLFGSGTFPQDAVSDVVKDSWGIGVGAAMFFTENFGISTAYNVFDTDPSARHFVTMDAVVRFPIHELCIAPYVFGGGGLVTNGSTKGLYRLGGGIDIRLDSMGCVGFFVDAAYNWIDNPSAYNTDTVIARVGIKIPF